jgi:hypothetical protein
MALKVLQNRVHTEESAFLKELASKDKILKDCQKQVQKMGKLERMGKLVVQAAENFERHAGSQQERHGANQELPDIQPDCHLPELTSQLKAISKDCHTVKSLLPKTPK